MCASDAVLGHASLTTTAIYTTAIGAQARELVNRVWTQDRTGNRRPLAMKAGWVVFDLGALPRAGGPSSEVAIVTGGALELSARAHDLEAESVPRWWRA